MSTSNQNYKELAIPYFKESFDCIDEVMQELRIPYFLIGVSGIAQKECNEALYWVELLNACGLFESEAFDELRSKVTEFLNLLTSIILSAKNNLP